jgi:hypothetical protein
MDSHGEVVETTVSKVVLGVWAEKVPAELLPVDTIQPNKSRKEIA